MCGLGLKQWLPWVAGMGLVVLKVAARRRRRQEAHKEKQVRRERLTNAMNRLQLYIDNIPVPMVPSSDFGEVLIQLPVHSDAARSIKSAQPVKPAPKPRIEIAEPRKINGFLDAFVELGEWWASPLGEAPQTTSENMPAADEEKALLKDHYEQAG
jgi:hypothetical protein